MTSNRRDLINGLAAAMGAGTFAATTYEGTNRYDKGTGTGRTAPCNLGDC